MATVSPPDIQERACRPAVGVILDVDAQAEPHVRAKSSWQSAECVVKRRGRHQAPKRCGTRLRGSTQATDVCRACCLPSGQSRRSQPLSNLVVAQLFIQLRLQRGRKHRASTDCNGQQQKQHQRAGRRRPEHSQATTPRSVRCVSNSSSRLEPKTAMAKWQHSLSPSIGGEAEAERDVEGVAQAIIEGQQGRPAVSQGSRSVKVSHAGSVARLSEQVVHNLCVRQGSNNAEGRPLFVSNCLAVGRAEGLAPDR